RAAGADPARRVLRQAALRAEPAGVAARGAATDDAAHGGRALPLRPERLAPRRRSDDAAGHPAALLRHPDHLPTYAGRAVGPAGLGEVRLPVQPPGWDLPTAPHRVVPRRVPRQIGRAHV